MRRLRITKPGLVLISNENQSNMATMIWLLYLTAELNILYLLRIKTFSNNMINVNDVYLYSRCSPPGFVLTDTSCDSSVVADWLKWSKLSWLLARGTGTRAESCRVKSASPIELPWLLCHLQPAGDKWLFATLSSSFSHGRDAQTIEVVRCAINMLLFIVRLPHGNCK